MSPPLSLARFFLTLQLVYKIKIENPNAILDIFVSDTSVVRNIHLPGFEKEYFSCMRTHTTFVGLDFGISVFVLLKFKDCLKIMALL